MANYNTLKTSVAAVIKENGNNEITGDILQQTLIAMINSLGVGYQYMGVAKPSTNPGAPDQRVFYIAAEPGTYTGFNAEVVPGEIAIFKFLGAWQKESVAAIDLGNVGFKGVFESGIGLDPSDGEEIVDLTYDASDYIPVGPGYVIVYSGGETDGNRAAIIGYDEDKYMVSVLLAGGSDWKNKIVAITDPDIKYVRVSSCNANHEYYNTPFAFNVIATTDLLDVIKRMQIRISELDELLSTIEPVIDIVRNEVLAGYTFRGVATPNIELDLPQARVFYLCTEPGNYDGVGTLGADSVALLTFTEPDNWALEVIDIAKKSSLDAVRNTVTALGETLLKVLSVVAAGYEYIGEVVPTSVFPSDTYQYKVAFLAQTPGAYNNHGRFVIGENEIALLMYDPASEEWSKLDLDFAKGSYVEETFAKQNGEYQAMKVGQSEVAENVPSAKEDSPMFTFRKTPVAANVLRIDEIKGKSIDWNQIFNYSTMLERTTAGLIISNSNNSVYITGAPSGSIPFTLDIHRNLGLVIGHKYIITIDSTDGVSDVLIDAVPALNQVFTFAGGNGYLQFQFSKSSYNNYYHVDVIDLTAMFGATIADAMTVEKYEALYGGVHGFNSGAIKNLTTFGMKFVGFNQWNEKWELGTIGSTGENVDSTTQIRSTNYIPVEPGKTYYFLTHGNNVALRYYDEDMNFLQVSSIVGGDSTFNIPNNAYYLRFHLAASYGTTYHNDICVNYSGPRNGQYEPYHEEIVYMNIGGGFNRWNEQWQLGDIDNTGAVVSGNRVVSKDFIPVQGNTDYYFYQGTIATGSNIAPVWYDANKAFISGNTFIQNGINKSPANARYLKFRMAVDYGTTYHNDICISYDVPGLNGTYQPYTVLTGKLDGQGESVELFTDGAKGVGTAHDLIRKNDCDVVMGHYEVTAETEISVASVAQGVVFVTLPSSGKVSGQCLTPGYGTDTTHTSGVTQTNGTIRITGPAICIKNTTAFTGGMTEQQVRSLINGMQFVYELATPKHYVFDKPLNLMAKTDPDGTQMLLPPQTGMSEPTSAPMLAEIEYYVNALKGVVKVGTLTNLLESLKTAGTISAYTMTWNDATGEYDFTITA